MEREGSGGLAAREAGPNRVGRSLELCEGWRGPKGWEWEEMGPTRQREGSAGQGDQKEADFSAKLQRKVRRHPRAQERR